MRHLARTLIAPDVDGWKDQVNVKNAHICSDKWRRDLLAVLGLQH